MYPCRASVANSDITNIRIVVNPDKLSDDYFKTWKAIQAKYREAIQERFSTVPILNATLFENEIVGLDMLKRLSDEVFINAEPSAILYSNKTLQIEKNAKLKLQH